MSHGQPKHEALTTALAFHYQALIGLDSCFSLCDGQAVLFEKDGDVSLLGDDVEQASQTEVKNYADKLTDNHENLWKTLKNWLALEFEHEKYGTLILHTTQAFGVRTKLKEWNKKSAVQRVEILRAIYGKRTPKQLLAKKPSEIVKFQMEVMETDPKHLMDVVAKVNLFTESDDEVALRENILLKPVGIPRNNHEHYLQALVGFVYDQANSHSWEVKKEDFVVKCEELTAIYCKREFTFPPFEGYEASDADVNQHQDKLFVKKINEINHCSVIPDAIGNWIELQNSLMEELDGYPLYAQKTTNYQNKIIKRFKLDYSTAELSENSASNSSKILYNKTIAELPLNMGNTTPPIEYKNGLIHDAMDDEERELKWKVES